MPYKSKAQAAYFNIHRREMEAQGVNVDEWNSASKGMKLPKKVKKKADGGRADDPIEQVLKDYRHEELGKNLGEALGQGVIPPEMLYLQRGIDPSAQQGDRNIYKPDDITSYRTHPSMKDWWTRGGRSYADGGDVEPDYELGNDVPPSFRDTARGVVGAFSKMGDYLGIPQEEIRNKQGDVVFPTNAVERGLQGSDRPTKEFASGVLGGGGGPGGHPGAYQSMFVGPYGALALRNRATEPGQLRALEHPVVRAAQARGEEPWLGITDAAKRDDVARDLLEYRRLAGDPRDEDIWRGSGWFRGEEGAAKKEIPDIGAKLIRSAPGEFRLHHPAGDFHEVYDVPPIKARPDPYAQSQGATAGFNPRTNEIILYGEPTQSRMKSAMPDTLHEMTHAIQGKEGWPMGSAPQLAKARPAYEQEFGRPADRETLIREGFAKQIGHMSDKELADFSSQNPKFMAALRAYHRSAGEVEARNVPARRGRSYSYLSHPEETMDVSPGLLDLHREGSGYPVGWLTKPTKRAAGGGIPLNIQHAGARQLVRNGMLHSKVPGRTDNLNIKVPSGSYVIPADVVSGLGQGNSMGGAAVMQKMFSQGPAGSSTGPLGMPVGIKSRGARGVGHAARLGTTKLPKGSKTTATLDQTFADGGPTGQEIQAEEHVGEPTPIDAAGGEYLVHPAVVRRLGRGNLKQGHEVLDAFVLHARDQIIKQMQDLKPPVKSTAGEPQP